MKDVIVIIAVTAVIVFGFFIMKRLDAFLEENRKAIEKEQEEQCSPLEFLDTENYESMISEIEIFKEKHKKIAVVILDEEDRELTETLNNYKSSTTVIVTNMMGDDFKINLVGDNEIGSIGSYGDAWGGSINISGNGSLVINADKSDDYGIAFFAEGTNSVLSVADTCNVTIYSGSKAVVYTSDNLTN